MNFKIETLAIGDELLTGRTSDTNSTHVANELFRIGLRLERIGVIPDEADAIIDAVRSRQGQCDVLICFGGLGPTSDDKTAQVIASYLGTSLAEDPSSLEKLKEHCRIRGRALTDPLLKQVKFPKAARPLPNELGLAPGFSCFLGKCQAFFLPGVPDEMIRMFAAHVLPEISKIAPPEGRIRSQVWRCVGVPEAELQRILTPTENRLPTNTWIGYRTRFPENHVTLYGRSTQTAIYDGFVDEIRKTLQPWCYSEEDKDLETVLYEKLSSRRLSIAFAESCTGGLCSSRLTRIAGSSTVFWGSVVVYQDNAKQVLLGVDSEPEGAISPECSFLLASRLKEKSGCDLAVTVTGCMGPTGATEKAPIGTSFICVLGDRARQHRVVHPGFSREATQWAASTHVLNQVRLFLDEK